MKSKDVLWSSRGDRLTFSFEDLLARTRLTDRANWTDLPRAPGIYLVCWTGAEQPIFIDGTGGLNGQRQSTQNISKKDGNT